MRAISVNCELIRGSGERGREKEEEEWLCWVKRRSIRGGGHRPFLISHCTSSPPVAASSVGKCDGDRSPHYDVRWKSGVTECPTPSLFIDRCSLRPIHYFLPSFFILCLNLFIYLFVMFNCHFSLIQRFPYAATTQTFPHVLSLDAFV